MYKNAVKNPVASALSLFRRRAEQSAGGLPDLILAAERTAASVRGGEHRQRRAGGGERFWQFRDYDPSDRPQDIDWRQSGKGDRVFVRQREWQTAQSVFFWLQSGEGMEYRSRTELPAKREDGLVIALSLGLLLARRGERIGAFAGAHRPSGGGAALERIAGDLWSGAAGNLPEIDTSRLPLRAGLVLVGDFLGDLGDIEKTFAALGERTANATVIQVLDPAEIELPFSGRVMFEETGGDLEVQAMNVESIRAAYRARIDSHLDAVRGLALRRGWRWHLHRTDGTVRGTLFALWRTMGEPGTMQGGRG